VSATIERRLLEAEAAVDRIAPKADPTEAQIRAENPWIRWLTCDELTRLEAIYRGAEDARRDGLNEAEEAEALSIAHAAEARRLRGEPADDEKPNPYRAER
jgi:hypothetical protein